jgi:hypothetical protein
MKIKRYCVGVLDSWTPRGADHPEFCEHRIMFFTLSAAMKFRERHGIGATLYVWDGKWVTPERACPLPDDGELFATRQIVTAMAVILLIGVAWVGVVFATH